MFNLVLHPFLIQSVNKYFYMSKVNEVLHNYITQSGIILEQDPMAPPLPPMDPAGAPPAPAVPPPPGEPVPGEEGGKTVKFTDQGYVVAVSNMLELLSINPEQLGENDLEIFTNEPNPKNAMDIHKDLKDLISRHGSPTS